MATQLTINGTPRTFDQPVATVADVVRALAAHGDAPLGFTHDVTSAVCAIGTKPISSRN